MANIDGRDETGPPKPWGTVATVLWTLLTLFVSAIVLVPTEALWTGGKHPPSILSDGPRLSFAALVSTAVWVEVLAWAARRRGWQAADYLGWVVPKPRDAAVTLTVIVALILAFGALDYLLDRTGLPSFQINTYRSAREAGGLVMLWIAFVAAGPLSEEILFRGFLYRGWARSPGAVVPAVVVISALWAILHLPQYDWLVILQIFLLGLVLGWVLGWVRWRSGSTMLTFAMHAFNNAWALVATHWLA